jgi:hypothetical protein
MAAESALECATGAIHVGEMICVLLLVNSMPDRCQKLAFRVVISAHYTHLEEGFCCNAVKAFTAHESPLNISVISTGYVDIAFVKMVG